LVCLVLNVTVPVVPVIIVVVVIVVAVSVGLISVVVPVSVASFVEVIVVIVSVVLSDLGNEALFNMIKEAQLDSRGDEFPFPLYFYKNVVEGIVESFDDVLCMCSCTFRIDCEGIGNDHRFAF